ncbi:MAG: 2-hydroxyacid dehydrogenase [Rhizobiaceae bacterium]|nr:2-hydroxyacid dehydrogenase [Rhizobiaceae bacterium]
MENGLADRFALIRFWEDERRRPLGDTHWPGVRALSLCIETRVDDSLLARFPDLEIISTFGAGYDHIDLGATSRCGLVVTNTPGLLDEDVADLALGLMIATVRQIPQAERFLRSGQWRQAQYPLTPTLRGRKVGIAGLGRIGSAIARRLAPFVDEVSYCGRSRQQAVPYPFFSTIRALAQWSDVLVCALPGGSSTSRMVDAAVLKALGPDGIFINVGRGSVVDQPALISALKTGEILAAGLDVYEEERAVPADLLDCERAVLLPHVGSSTHRARQAMGDLLVRNLSNWFTHGAALTPVTT